MEQRTAAAIDQFDALALDLADGVNVPLDQIERILRATERTGEDLEQAVALIEKRRGWQQQAEALPEHEGTLADAEGQRAGLVAEYEQRLAEIDARIGAARRGVKESELAAVQLKKTRPQWHKALTHEIGMQILNIDRLLASRVLLEGDEVDILWPSPHADHGDGIQWTVQPSGAPRADIDRAMAAVREREAELEERKAEARVKRAELVARKARLHALAQHATPTREECEAALATIEEPDVDIEELATADR
jgi:DNA repair exonuclease SbcCD ATPase subunit